MKSKIWLVLLGIIGSCFLSNIDSVHANELDNKFYFDTWIPDIFIRKEYGDYVQNQQARFTRRQSDGIPVYCIETGPLVYDDEIYNSFTDNLDSITGYSIEQIEKVKLIAYYGYGYDGHYEDKWYSITQVLIWKTIYPYMDIYYTDAFRGNRIEKFVDEEKEILDLVERHSIKPMFDDLYEVIVNKKITIEDKNHVLDNYEVEVSNNINIEKTNNSLVIDTNNIGDAEIKLYKKANRFNYIPIVYINDKSQNLFMAGDYDTLEEVINFKVIDIEKPKTQENIEKVEEEKEIITVDVPNTFQDKNNLVYFSSFLCILIGSIILNVKKKNK